MKNTVLKDVIEINDLKVYYDSNIHKHVSKKVSRVVNQKRNKWCWWVKE